MAEVGDVDGDCRPTKSINSNFSTHVKFVNKSKRRVQVIWLDFRGRPVWYYDLQPGKSYNQQTFVTHPWKCVESDSGRFEEMLINSQSILYPEKADITGVITEKKTSLYELCRVSISEALHENLGISKLDKLKEQHLLPLPIPQRLKNDLLTFETTPSTSHVATYVATLRHKLRNTDPSSWHGVLESQRTNPNGSAVSFTC